MTEFIFAIAADDKGGFSKGHFGDARSFEIYRIESRQAKLLRKMDNPEVNTSQHSSKGKMKSVLQSIDECEVIVASRESPNFRRMLNLPFSSFKVLPVILKDCSEMEEAIGKVIEHADKINEMIQKKKKGESFDSVPSI